MIRRFETYAFLPGTSSISQERLATVLAEAGRYIPEVLHCAVGWNVSDAPARLIWEHAFESAESYQRYMVHPYHVEMIDRYVLADSPERIVEAAKGAGLFGYHCGDISPVSTCAGRRVVLLDIEPETAVDELEVLFGKLGSEATTGGAAATAGGPNTLAATWFDGVNPLPIPPPKWSHVWEAGYPSLPAGEVPPSLVGGPIRRFRELRYELVD
jgi:hypothetical protein